MKKNYVHVPTPENFDFWIENGLNVLFIGRHGVGKTTMIENAFKRHNIRHKYFSASTMDPFLDFIGVPKEMHDEKGPYLELVKPKEFRDDEVEALFFDEFNRSPKKIRNAVMELIQFKSINGRKFPNLKFVWAAINPEDDENASYDVEPLDPAQKDRFHIQIELPYKPSVTYFEQKFGEDIADSACDWWNNLPDDAKKEVSPRRLDMALEIHKKGGNLRHVISPVANIEKLAYALKHGSPAKKFNNLLISKPIDKITIRKFLNVENNYSAVLPIIIKEFKTVGDCLESEKIISLAHEEKEVLASIISVPTQFQSVLETLADAGQNKTIRKAASDCLLKSGLRVKKLTPNTSDVTRNTADDLIKKGIKLNPTPYLKLTPFALPASIAPITQNDIIPYAETATSISQKTSVLVNILHVIHGLPSGAMTKTAAEEFMSIIEWACSRCQPRTLSTFGSLKLPVAVNVCCVIIGDTAENLVRRYPNVFVRAMLNAPSGCGLKSNQWIVTQS